MTENARLQVFAGMGCYDVTTGYFAQKYMLNHLGLAPPLRANIRQAAYPAGHQLYNHLPTLKQLRSDVADFVNTTAPIRGGVRAGSADPPRQVPFPTKRPRSRCAHFKPISGRATIPRKS